MQRGGVPLIGKWDGWTYYEDGLPVEKEIVPELTPAEMREQAKTGAEALFVSLRQELMQLLERKKEYINEGKARAEILEIQFPRSDYLSDWKRWDRWVAVIKKQGSTAIECIPLADLSTASTRLRISTLFYSKIIASGIQWNSLPIAFKPNFSPRYHYPI